MSPTPFENARARAAFMPNPTSSTSLDGGGFGLGLVVDLGQRSVHWRGHPIPLTRLEFDLLALLARDPGRVFSYHDCSMNVWDADYMGDPSAIQAVSKRLRRKLHLAGVSAALRLCGVSAFG